MEEEVSFNKDMEKEMKEERDRENFNEHLKEMEFFDSKESLALYQESKEELIDRLKNNWKEYHSRIHDIKQKKLAKFPQVYFLKYKCLIDDIDGSVNSKAQVFSKYTINLDNDVEIDLGGSMFMRNSMGLGSILSGLRFYCFNKQMYNSIYYTFGEKKELTLELNYLFPKKKMLVDYVHKNNTNMGINTHSLTFYKTLNHEVKGDIGFTFDRANNNHTFNVSMKKYFGTKTSFEASSSFFMKYGLLKTKLKNCVTTNIYTIAKNKIENSNVYPKFYNKNQIIYKHYNKLFKVGYFQNVDGVGFEFGYCHGGVEITFPVSFLKTLDFTTTNYSTGLISFMKGYIVWNILNLLTNYTLKKIKKWWQAKDEEAEAYQKNRKNVFIRRYDTNLMISQIRQYAEINQNIELKMGPKGLIIHFAFYGNKKNLKHIMSSLGLMSQENLSSYISDPENEIFDVTIPVRYLLKRDPKSTYTTIFFYQVPKTQILGFINPIFKKVSIKPSLLIKYEINGKTTVVLKNDKDLFQIPENISVN